MFSYVNTHLILRQYHFHAPYDDVPSAIINESYSHITLILELNTVFFVNILKSYILFISTI